MLQKESNYFSKKTYCYIPTVYCLQRLILYAPYTVCSESIKKKSFALPQIIF